MIFDLATGDAPDTHVAAEGRPIFEAAGIDFRYVGGADRLHLRYGTSAAAVSVPRTGMTSVWMRRGDEDAFRAATRVLLTVSLLEGLRRRGLFSVHASGFALRGAAYLFPAKSGGGKSTIAIALLRAGFGRFLGDDTVLVAPRGGLRVLAFPDEIDVTDVTLASFPELAACTRSNGPWKHAIRPERFYNVDVAWESRPSVIAFPFLTSQSTALEPLRPEEALIALVPNVFATDVSTARRHLDALAELVRLSRCYRLALGPDVERLPGLLRDA